MPTFAIAYIRVSTQEQALHGISLDAQEARVRAYASMTGLDLVEVIREEGVSASRPLGTRPGGQHMADLVASGQVHHVVALKLDRLFRDVLDALTQTREWDKAGVNVHLVDMGGQAISTGTAMGKMFLTMMAGFAELERNLISERTSAALQQKKALGVQLGAPGLADETTLTRIKELRLSGLTLRGIAEVLTREGRQTVRGGRWHAQTVWKLLGRKLNGNGSRG